VHLEAPTAHLRLQGCALQQEGVAPRSHHSFVVAKPCATTGSARAPALSIVLSQPAATSAFRDYGALLGLGPAGLGGAATSRTHPARTGPTESLQGPRCQAERSPLRTLHRAPSHVGTALSGMVEAPCPHTAAPVYGQRRTGPPGRTRREGRARPGHVGHEWGRDQNRPRGQKLLEVALRKQRASRPWRPL
jgi:hypothetical protein